MFTHPQRQQIANEVHIKPFQRLSAPLKVMHFVLMHGPYTLVEIKASIANLLISCGVRKASDLSDFHFQTIDQLSIRWEAHTEYHTLTIYYSGEEQNWQQTMPGLPVNWSETILGELITGVQLLVRSTPGGIDGTVPERLFGENQVIGSHVMRGAGTVWTDFRAQGEFRLDRILVHDNHLHGYQCGRLIQRLCEIDTYRAIALLGLAPAQQSMTEIISIETELAIIARRLSHIESKASSEALQSLIQLGAQIEEISVETANRFSASDAYYALVKMRISELEESRVEGLPTMAQFIERRVDPAMRTWKSAASRINRVSKRINQASSLLRSRIDLATDQKVHTLLTSMNKRTRRQLLLQAKLETFSIIVVTYYIFDLVERTIHQLSSGTNEELAISWLSYSLPVVIIIVWWYVRRVTKEFKSDD